MSEVEAEVEEAEVEEEVGEGLDLESPSYPNQYPGWDVQWQDDH